MNSKIYKLMAASNVNTSVTRNENGVSIDYDIPSVAHVNLNMDLIARLDSVHPLLKIVFTFWVDDCKDEFVPFYKYLSDERVLNNALNDDKCAKYVLTNAKGEMYINPSTASKFLYKFQSLLSKDDISEIIRFGYSANSNPYLKSMIKYALMEYYSM